MHLHDLAFWAAASFLGGVFLISIFGSMTAVFLIAGILAVYFVLLKKRHWQLIVFVLIGAFYYQAFDIWQRRVEIPFGGKVQFDGIVGQASHSAAKQEIVLELQNPYRGKIKVYASPYPAFSYGDLVSGEGAIKRPLGDAVLTFAKDGIFGVSNFPKLELKKSGEGNFLKSRLFVFKNRILRVFKSVLPADQAALLAGITLGERANFSRELEQKMSLSGTAHLVALSGYNIGIIAWTLGLVFNSYLSRTFSFYLSIFSIILFVLMTGAEASVVRAAIMGIILLFAKETERLFSIRNAIIIAAFLMTLANPKILVFDAGFQLSFAALAGIVYLEPVLRKLFNPRDNSGFLKWKENLLTTLSAQLAVVPLLLGNFGVFSLTSFLANVLVLEAVPLTMGLGFLMGGLGLASDFLAKSVGLLINLFLEYELWIIDVFSRFSLPIFTESFGFLPAMIYYSLLILFIYKDGFSPQRR